MLEFLKRCGLGVLYVIAAPFALALLALFAVFGLLTFCFMLVKSLILFFSGRSVFDDLPEDIEAKRRLGTLVDTRVKKPVTETQPTVTEHSAEPEEKTVETSPEIKTDAALEDVHDEKDATHPGGEA